MILKHTVKDYRSIRFQLCALYSKYHQEYHSAKQRVAWPVFFVYLWSHGGVEIKWRRWRCSSSSFNLYGIHQRKEEGEGISEISVPTFELRKHMRDEVIPHFNSPQLNPKLMIGSKRDWLEALTCRLA
jgi:hypothetical protein